MSPEFEFALEILILRVNYSNKGNSLFKKIQIRYIWFRIKKYYDFITVIVGEQDVLEKNNNEFDVLEQK